MNADKNTDQKTMRGQVRSLLFLIRVLSAFIRGRFPPVHPRPVSSRSSAADFLPFIRGCVLVSIALKGVIENVVGDAIALLDTFSLVELPVNSKIDPALSVLLFSF